MIDTDKYEGHTPAPWTIDIHKVGEDISAIVIESNMTTHSNCVLAEVEVENKYAEADAQLIADAPLLLQEVKRLREENETLRKMDWEYECLWTWLDENTNLLNTIEPLVEEWKKEYDEE